MYKYLFIILVIGITGSLFGDDVIEVNKINERDIGKYTLGILPIILGDSIKVGQLNQTNNQEKKKKLNDLLWKYFMRNINNHSKFSANLPCTTINYNIVKQKVEIKGSEVTFNKIDTIDKNEFNYLLLIDLAFVYDDSSSISLNPDFFTGFSFNPISRKPEEECINYGCKFTFYNTRTHQVDYYGIITAEGCGYTNERYSDVGCWANSINDLIVQIFEDTKFQLKPLDASDFK